MSLPEPGAATKNDGLENKSAKEEGVTKKEPPAVKKDGIIKDPSTEKTSDIIEEPSTEKKGDLIEDPAAEKKDGNHEDPPAEKKDDEKEAPPTKKKVKNLFPTEKSPVQLLQEYLDKNGEEALFEFDTVGAFSELRFIGRVRVGVEVFTGAGITKKAAKQSAAGAALEALNLRDPALAGAPKAPAFTSEGQNPISVLNQLTSQKKIPTAEYALVGEQVMGNRTLFTMSCRVGKVVETGCGHCKKVAKQEAALKVLEKLKREPVREPNTARQFSEHRREIHGGRGRDSPYPCTTKPFTEPRRCHNVQNFDSTTGKNAQYPLSEAFPNTGSIRHMDLRQDHSAQEMHRAQGCDAQYPRAYGALNTGASSLLMANQSYSTGDLYTAPRDDAAFHLAGHSMNSGTIGPHMDFPQDNSAREKCIFPPGNVAPDTGFPGSLNTGTNRPFHGPPQYLSAQKRNRPPGDNAEYPVAQQFLNSGIIRPLQTYQQDTAVPELCPAPKDSGTQQLDTTMGKNADFTGPPLKLSRTHNQAPEHQQDTSSQELKTPPGHNAGGTGPSLNPTMIKLLKDNIQVPSIQELRTALGYIARCTGSSSNSAITRPLQEYQQGSSGQELNITLGQNAGFTGSSLNSTMIGSLQEHPQDPSTRELNTTQGHNAGFMSSSLNPAMITPIQERVQDPSMRQSATTRGNDALCICSPVSQNTVAVTPSLQQHGDLKPQELNPATGTNAKLTFPVYTPKPASILDSALKHQQEPRVEQVTIQTGNNANYTLPSPIPRTTMPLLGHWQGTPAPGFNMKQGNNVQYLWAQASTAVGTRWPPQQPGTSAQEFNSATDKNTGSARTFVSFHPPSTVGTNLENRLQPSAAELNTTQKQYTGSTWTWSAPIFPGRQ